MSKRWLVSLLFLSWIALPGSLAAQDEEFVSSSFEDMIEVSEVFLDLLVTDPEGEVAVGLGKDDFIVEEAGEPVEITSVSYYTTRYGDAAAGDEIPTSRYFLFFFHSPPFLGNSSRRLMTQQIRVGVHTRRWIEEEMQPSDWLAVASYDTRLKIYQDFTQDRDALEKAIKDAVARRKVDPTRASRGPGGEPPVLRRLPEGRDLRQQTTNVYDALRLVAEATGYLVGRKNLMLFTLGLEEEVDRRGEPQLDPELYPALETALNDHNVAVYPINTTPAGHVHEQSELLEQLAEDTGGYYDENFIGFFTPVERVAEENHGYYLLSFRTARRAGEIGYQRVEVRAQDPNLAVRTRKGYRYGL